MKKGVLILTLSFFISTIVSGAGTSPRLAVCSSGDEKAGVILALMEPGLSKDGNVILLDRANVQKVLAEHNLSLAGFLSTGDALKAGQLLQCDIFSELHYEKATNGMAEAVSVVAFDAATGVRLCDEALPPVGSIEEFARSATRVLLKGIGKWQRKKGSFACRTVSLLSVRNVDLPPQMSGIPDCIGILIARQILRSPDVAVLERERLDQINRESGLTGDRRAELLGSTVLLDLDISARGGNIRVHASMRDITGKEIGALDVEKKASELGQLSEDVVNAVLKHLRLSPVKNDAGQDSNINFRQAMKIEASRFYQEAVFLKGHREYIRALPPIEAAHALDPANRQYLRELSFLLLDRAFIFLRPSSDPEANTNYPDRLKVTTEALEHSLKFADRSLDYRLTLLTEAMADPKVADKRPAVNEIIGQRGLDPYFQEFIATANFNHFETAQSLFPQVQRKALRCILDYSRVVEREAAVKNPHSLDFDSMWALEFIGRLRLYCGNANAEGCFPSIIGIAEDWLSLLEQDGYPAPIRIIYPSPMDPGQTIVGALKAAVELGPTPRSESTYKTLDTFFQQMENHPFPDIQIHGAYGRRWAESLRRSLSEEEKMISISAFFNEAKKKISLLPPDVPDIQLLNGYSAVLNAISPLEYETRRRMSVELFWVMKDRNELIGYVAERTLCDDMASTAHRKEALELTEATLSMLNNHACRVVKTDRGIETEQSYVKKEFEEIRSNLLLADPSLAKSIKVPWTQEKLLFQIEKGETGIRRIACPTVQEGCIYFAGFGADAKTGEHYVQLISVAIISGSPHFLKQARYDWDSQDGFSCDQTSGLTVYNKAEAKISCFSNNRYLLGTCRNGVYSFPVGDGLVEIINSERGLPSNSVRSMAVMGHELYLGLGDGYLVVYDLETGKSRTLASSRRKEKLSPFDDLLVPFDIPYLVADTARGRILAQVGFNRKQGRDISGLWAIDAKTKAMSRILPLYMDGEWGSGVIDDTLILADSFCSILFNCQTDQIKSLNSLSSSAAGPTLPFSSNLYGTHRALPPLVMIDKWLWSADSFGRISPDGKTQQVFPLPGEIKLSCPRVHLELIKNDGVQYLLVADQLSLWMLTLSRNAASGPRKSP